MSDEGKQPSTDDNMSVENNEAEEMLCCGSCGIAEVVDEITLKPCDSCDLVRYCSDECQKNHRSQHKETCKERAAELRDDLLFKQPESSHMEDCPICSLPLPLDQNKSTFMGCCGKTICIGCDYAMQKPHFEASSVATCPFCREHVPKTDEESEKVRMKRIEANDPEALCYEGMKEHDKGDYQRAFDYFTKAVQLGDTLAHHRLADMYHEGDGVEKNLSEEIHHLEEAAIGGHPVSRHNLAVHEWNKGEFERAVKHLIIAAKQGNDGSMKALIKAFRAGYVSKEELAAALRAHQATVDETKSLLRDAAEEFLRKNYVRGYTNLFTGGA